MASEKGLRDAIRDTRTIFNAFLTFSFLDALREDKNPSPV